MRLPNQLTPLLLAMAGWASVASLAHAVEPVTDRSFSFTADPEVRVLAVTYSGTLLMYRPVYSLYGDGRFVAEKQSQGGETLESVEVTLSFEQAESLLRTLVDHGFLDTTQWDIEHRLSGDRVPPRPIDGGTMTVALHLDSYTRGEVTAGPVTHRISIAAPGRPSTLDSAVPELRGLALLSERLVELGRQVENPTVD